MTTLSPLPLWRRIAPLTAHPADTGRLRLLLATMTEAL